MFVSFQKFILSIDDFKAIILSAFDNKESVTTFAFSNDSFSFFC